MMTARVITTAKHDDRKGHHYYTTPSTSASCIVVMTLAVIMPAISLTLQKHEPHPSLGEHFTYLLSITRVQEHTRVCQYSRSQEWRPNHNKMNEHVPHWSAVHAHSSCYRS